MGGVRKAFSIGSVADQEAKQSPGEVTRLLEDLSSGHQKAADQLIPLVYEGLRQLAGRYLSQERPGHTLQPTALVHEAYLQLVDQRQVRWQNRAHFFGVAATLMRRILMEHARNRQAAKRGGSAQKVSLDEAAALPLRQDVDLLALDDALTSLTALDARQSRVVELRFFGGLTVEEIGEVLGVSPTTVKREWRLAKAWLARELDRKIADEP